MIEALKHDDLARRVGGNFRLTALIQRRLKEIVEGGARPLVATSGKTMIEVVVEEIAQGKIEIDYEKTPDLAPPTAETTRDTLHGHNPDD